MYHKKKKISEWDTVTCEKISEKETEVYACNECQFCIAKGLIFHDFFLAESCSLEPNADKGNKYETVLFWTFFVLFTLLLSPCSFFWYIYRILYPLYLMTWLSGSTFMYAICVGNWGVHMYCISLNLGMQCICSVNFDRCTLAMFVSEPGECSKSSCSRVSRSCLADSYF